MPVVKRYTRIWMCLLNSLFYSLIWGSCNWYIPFWYISYFFWNGTPPCTTLCCIVPVRGKCKFGNRKKLIQDSIHGQFNLHARHIAFVEPEYLCFCWPNTDIYLDTHYLVCLPSAMIGPSIYINWWWFEWGICIQCMLSMPANPPFTFFQWKLLPS